ncbi:MAG TPA: glycosyltransferase family 2 protein, partial [Roseiflexaceae bacterium]|nr:glycosyltransferase family 2 protein [Roseiflexaceae bacterium]
PTDYERDAAGLEQGEFVTASCFCRRAALEAVGGFDERFTTAWREDSDLQFMFMERGDPIARVADAVVIHPVRPASWGISISQQRKSMFNALLYKKHPQLYRERIQAALPWRYYLICASAAGALIACVLGRRRASLAGLALWAALVGRFCSQRLRHTARTPTHIAEMLVISALLPPLAIFWRLRGALKYRIVFL